MATEKDKKYPSYNDWDAQSKRTKGYTANTDLENTTSFAKRSPRATPGIPQSPFAGRKKPVDIPGPVQRIDPEPVVEPEPQAMSFSDYLALAAQMGVGQGGVDYGGLRSQLQSQAQRGDSALNAMYSQLRGSIDADAPGIAQTYDQTSQGIGENGAAAIKTTNDAANSARQAQTSQLQALGIGDTAAVLAGAGGNAAADQAAAVSNIAQNQAAGQNQAVANKASALNYNTGVGNAAGLEGNIQRANLQADLQAKLAELGIREQEANAGNNDEQLQFAMQLMGQDRSAASDAAEQQAQAEQQDFDNRMSMADLVLRQTKAQGSQQTLQDQLGEQLGGAQTIYEAAARMGVKPDELAKILSAVG